MMPETFRVSHVEVRKNRENDAILKPPWMDHTKEKPADNADDILDP